MAHKTVINGTEYEITGGTTLANGTKYQIRGGRTIVDGTGYAVEFASLVYLKGDSSFSLYDYARLTVEGTTYNLTRLDTYAKAGQEILIEAYRKTDYTVVQSLYINNSYVTGVHSGLFRYTYVIPDGITKIAIRQVTTYDTWTYLCNIYITES